MCGIFGFVRPKNKGLFVKELSGFAGDAMVCGTVRGTDGTGIFYKSDSDIGCKMVKKPFAGFDFKQTLAFKNVAKEVLNTSRFAVFHNRSATQGGINDEACHPFREGDITLVHNGTLRMWRTMIPKESPISDSHAITRLISTKGLQETTPMLDGSFSLVYHDNSNGTLNFVRNNERPMYVGITTEGIILFASEVGMLLWLASRHSMEIKETRPVPVLTHIQLNLETMEFADEVPVQGWKPPFYGNSYNESYFPKDNNRNRGSLQKGWGEGNQKIFEKGGKGGEEEDKIPKRGTEVTLFPSRIWGSHKHPFVEFSVEGVNGITARASGLHAMGVKIGHVYTGKVDYRVRTNDRDMHLTVTSVISLDNMTNDEYMARKRKKSEKEKEVQKKKKEDADECACETCDEEIDFKKGYGWHEGMLLCHKCCGLLVPEDDEDDIVGESDVVVDLYPNAHKMMN